MDFVGGVGVIGCCCVRLILWIFFDGLSVM